MCWYAHPPQLPKYGHSGVTRSGEFSLTSTNSALANCVFSRTISAETSSPSIVYGTKTAFPCSRPTPLPPKAISSIFKSTTRIRLQNSNSEIQNKFESRDEVFEL